MTTPTAWVVYCPNHKHWLASASADVLAWTDDMDESPRFTKARAKEAAASAAGLDHNPTLFAIPSEIDQEFGSLTTSLYARRYTPGAYQPARRRGGETYRAAVGSIDYLIVSHGVAIAWRVESGAVFMVERDAAPDVAHWDWVRQGWRDAGVEVRIRNERAKR